jgi:hypothetical protein
MLRQGPISLTLHAMLEPFVAALLIAAPFLFGFSDRGAPTAVAIVAGIGVLMIGMSTQWRLSLIKAIPISAHLTLDLIVGGLLIASPFLFGFSDAAAPTVFFLVMGVAEILWTLATRWYPARGSEPGDDGGGGRMRRRRGGVSGSQPTG